MIPSKIQEWMACNSGTPWKHWLKQCGSPQLVASTSPALGGMSIMSIVSTPSLLLKYIMAHLGCQQCSSFLLSFGTLNTEQTTVPAVAGYMKSVCCESSIQVRGRVHKYKTKDLPGATNTLDTWGSPTTLS